MNLKQEQALKLISACKYTDIPIYGNEFKKWIKTCEYIHTQIKDLSEEEKKNFLQGANAIIFKEIRNAEKVGYKPEDDRDIMFCKNASILTNSYLEVLNKRLCEGLLKFYKFLIVGMLFDNKNFSKAIIQFYVDGTSIGGVEKRGWSSQELDSIVNFMTKNKEIMQAYASNVIYLGTNGYILIRDTKSLDNLGENIHASYTAEMMEKKMSEEEKLYQKRTAEIKIEEGVQAFINDTKNDDYDDLPTLSLKRNACEDICVKKVWPGKWDEKEMCACNVRKNGWLGTYLEPEECSNCD